LFVRLPAWNNSAPTKTDFREIFYLSIFKKISRKLKFRYNMKRITGILHENHEDQVSDRVLRKNKKHFS
jgi:hypothetical protein